MEIKFTFLSNTYFWLGFLLMNIKKKKIPVSRMEKTT